MALRYIDTGFYKSPFVRGLQGACKGLYSFIICECTGAGIWVKDLPIASEYIGAKITDSQFEENFIKTGKAIDLKNGKYFFPDFIEHQYPKGLSEKNPAQVNFILELRKYDLINEDLSIKNKGQQRPLEGSLVMVTVMEKVKVKETVKVKPTLIFNFSSEKFITIWQLLISQPKWKKKTNDALQMALNKMAKVDEQQAIQMMENTIAGGWQGIFEIEKNKNSNGNTKNKLQELNNFQEATRGINTNS